MCLTYFRDLSEGVCLSSDNRLRSLCLRLREGIRLPHNTRLRPSERIRLLLGQKLLQILHLHLQHRVLRDQLAVLLLLGSQLTLRFVQALDVQKRRERGHCDRLGQHGRLYTSPIPTTPTI